MSAAATQLKREDYPLSHRLYQIATSYKIKVIRGNICPSAPSLKMPPRQKPHPHLGPHRRLIYRSSAEPLQIPSAQFRQRPAEESRAAKGGCFTARPARQSINIRKYPRSSPMTKLSRLIDYASTIGRRGGQTRRPAVIISPRGPRRKYRRFFKIRRRRLVIIPGARDPPLT